MTLQGFFYPRTTSGASSLLPNPPWYYSGDLLTVEYRTDPERVAALLPEPLAPAADDPGAVALIWADWQSCGEDRSELLDPVRSQYKEAFVVVRCSFEGRTYSRCAFIWVDKDFAMLRGIHQGYPKKLGSIHMTRVMPFGKAAPRLEPGARFGATLAAYDHRLATARITITGETESNGFVNALPMLHNRQVRAIERDGGLVLDELVTMSGFDFTAGPAYAADAELELFDSPWDELATLLPAEEILGGYYRQVGTSWNGGTTVVRRPV